MAGTWDRHHDELCDFPTSFRSGHGTHFMRCSKYVERSNEKWTSDSSFFQSFYGRHHHSHPIPNRCRWFTTKVLTFSHGQEWRLSQRKVEVGGSVREIHFKIGGDEIPTAREKPVKSIGRLYLIPQTDRRRDTEVQKVALKGLKSMDKTCLPGKMKAWCY